MKRSHSLWLVVSALLTTAPAIAPTQIFPYREELWHMGRNRLHFASNVPVLGAQPVNGFKFAVQARPDGLLPLVQRLNSSVLEGNIIYLCRLQGEGYAIYAYWDHRIFPPSSAGGILLEPGTYLLVTDWSATSVIWHTDMLGGRWVGAEHQADYWDMRPGANAVVDALDKRGKPIHGAQFDVVMRGDGALPVVTDMIGTFYHGLLLWRKDTDGRFFLAADWYAEHPGSPGPEFTLAAGTYLLQTNPEVNSSTVRHARVLSGYWAKPAPPPSTGSGRG